MILLSFVLFAENSTAETKGISLFMDNKPSEAISWLELAVKEDPGNKNLYWYLGIAYEQTGQFGSAVSVYNRGLDKADDLKSIFLTNIANNLLRQKKYTEAVAYYTRAFDLDSNPDALRGRAGEYLRSEQYDKALQDYKIYLELEPGADQGDDIRRIISLLENRIDEIARQKLEEERKRLAEEARQKELLDQVLNSLNSAGDNTTNLSAGNEDIEEYSDDFDIVD